MHVEVVCMKGDVARPALSLHDGSILLFRQHVDVNVNVDARVHPRSRHVLAAGRASDRRGHLGVHIA